MSSTPTELVWDTNMAAVSLFWDTNMAAVASCENARSLNNDLKERAIWAVPKTSGTSI